MSLNSIGKIHAFLLINFTLLQILIAEQTERMPNLIILLADDLGYGELGCQGNKEIPTPCICLLYTSPSPRDRQKSRMPSSA